MESRVAVIGTGYVGLTTGACFAHLGHAVICADIDEEKVERLTRGEIPIHEPGLEEIVRAGIDSGRLRFTADPVEAASDADFVYLCVPTPQGNDGSADLSYLEAAARQVGPHLRSDAIVVNKSTVPVGSAGFVEQVMGRSDVHVVSNPEFLREGTAVHDFLHPDRVVIGAEDQSAAVRIAGLYLGLPAPFMVTDPASAETIKYASNAFLAMKLSFVNAIANLCEAVGADVNDVVLGMGYDKRIGHEFLRPGPGWGGSCFVGSETALVRRGWQVGLRSFEDLASDVDENGVEGLEVLAWAPGDPRPEFFPVAAFTVRPYDGDVVEVRTKMGRRLTVTADHPFVVCDGADAESTSVRLAGELTTRDWLPVAQDAPVEPEHALVHDLTASLAAAHIDPTAVICRLSAGQAVELDRSAHRLATSRRHDARRSSTLRLSELSALGIDPDGAALGTTTNGTYVPASILDEPELWWAIGLYLAEGHTTVDGRRERVTWSLHPHLEHDLVERLRAYWEGHGIRVTVARGTTTRLVSISSRVMGAWFGHGLRTGSDCYSKRIPDAIWGLGADRKRALLRGLWDGDGSWSYVNGGPSVVLEYGTVSRELADGMLRLLGDLGIVARLKVGRSAKSTTDAHFISISGADQVEDCSFLLPDGEAFEVRAALARQGKRTAPTGYRRLGKGAAWVRVTSHERRHHTGPVYSLEVPGPHTVVTTAGLVAHNCFPKDSKALQYIAKDNGYEFSLIDALLEQNTEQFDRVADKVARFAGGDVDGVTVAAWGLTFKADTDDRRQSPAIEVLSRLVARGARVKAFDPTVTATMPELPEVEVATDPYAACEAADVLVVLTEWDDFKWLDLDKVADLMAHRRIVDGRNLLDRAAVRRRGFQYEGIGRL